MFIVADSSQQFFINRATHVRQPKVPALVAEGQAFVVDAEAMEDRSLQVVDVDGIVRDVVA